MQPLLTYGHVVDSSNVYNYFPLHFQYTGDRSATLCIACIPVPPPQRRMRLGSLTRSYPQPQQHTCFYKCTEEIGPLLMLIRFHPLTPQCPSQMTYIPSPSLCLCLQRHMPLHVHPHCPFRIPRQTLHPLHLHLRCPYQIPSVFGPCDGMRKCWHGSVL